MSPDFWEVFCFFEEELVVDVRAASRFNVGMIGGGRERETASV
jgi:hypothetical protein